MSYLSLAIAAFLSATIIPFSSEVLLGVLIVEGLNGFGLWAAASFGNTLGACVNWWLGTRSRQFENKSWFPLSARQLERTERWFTRYGIWSLCFAWLPFVGDALTVFAGILKVRLRWFIPLVFIGKAGRYAVLIFIIGQVSPIR